MSARILLFVLALLLASGCEKRPTSGIEIPHAAEIEDQQNIHKQIDEIVVRQTGRLGYTNEASRAIIDAINNLGDRAHARPTIDGNIEVIVKGGRIPRIIAMKKLDTGL